MEKNLIPLPIIFLKEDKWFVAWCPIIDVSTQGKDTKEVRKNMEDLLKTYFKDPDTPKPTLKKVMSTSVSIFTIPIKMKGVTHSKTSTSIPA